MIIMKENKLRITLTSLASRGNWAKNERTIKDDKHEAKSIMWHSGWYTIFNDSMSGQFPTAERTSANIKPLLLEVSECVSKNNFGLYSQFPVILRFSFKTEKIRVSCFRSRLIPVYAWLRVWKGQPRYYSHGMAQRHRNVKVVSCSDWMILCKMWHFSECYQMQFYIHFIVSR